MRRIPDDPTPVRVRHNWRWWKYGFFRYMSGPYSLETMGLILLGFATAGGIIQLADGEAGPGVGLLAIGVVGIIAWGVHFEHRITSDYIDERDELIRRRKARPEDFGDN